MEEMNLLTKSDLHKRLSDQVKETQREADAVTTQVLELGEKVTK